MKLPVLKKFDFNRLDLKIAAMKTFGKFFPEEIVKKVHSQICELLADPEKAKAVRGKIHPSNIILFEDGEIQFIDMQGAEEVKSSAEAQPESK